MLVMGRENFWHRAAGPADMGMYDFSKPLRSPTPNDALICSQGACQNPDLALGTYDRSPEEIVKAATEFLTNNWPRTTRVDDGSDPNSARLVTYSNWMRFPDTTSIHARMHPNGKTELLLYARAQLGRLDFGVNRARLDALISALGPEGSL